MQTRIAIGCFFCYHLDMFRFINGQLYFEHKGYSYIPESQADIVHINYFHQIVYIVKGSAEVRIEDCIRRVGEGDIILIPAGKYHSATIARNEPYERYNLKFTDRFLPDFVREKLNAGECFFANSKKFEGIFSLFDEYANEYSPRDLHVIFSAELIKLVTMLYHEPAPAAEKNKAFISDLIAFIDENIRKNITIQMLTEKFHYSKSFIYAEFRKYMKMPLMKYIRTKKIIAVRQMILGGAKKTEAAELFGFENYSTFYRACKSIVPAPEAAEEN